MPYKLIRVQYLCTLMMQDQYHHNHTNYTTQLLLTPLLSFLIIQNILIWYWYEGKTVLATWVNYNIYESKPFKPKSKFSSIWSQGIYLQMISYEKLTSNSLTILMIDCWDCAAHFSFTKPSFFSSSSSLALRRFLYLFRSSCNSASFSLTVPSSF